MKTAVLKPILVTCLAAAGILGLPCTKPAMAAGHAPTPILGVSSDENGKKHLSVTVGGTKAVAMDGKLLPFPSGKRTDPDEQSHMMQAFAFARGLCGGEKRQGKTSDAWRNLPPEQQKELFAAYCVAVGNQIGKPISTSDGPALVFFIIDPQ